MVFKPTLKISKNGKTTHKGNVDTELVLHAMIEYSNYKSAIIISCDGDFYCLIDHLEKNGKLYKILIPNNKYSAILKKFAKYITPINLFKEKIEKI